MQQNDKGRIKRPTNPSADGDWSTPSGLFNKGMEFVPGPTKLVLGALVVFAAASIILAWARGLDVLIPVVIAIIVVGLVVALLPIAIRSARMGYLGEILAASLVVLFIATLCLFLSAAFFGTPQGGALILSHWLSAPELLPEQKSSGEPFAVSGAKPFTDLPSIMQMPIEDKVHRIDRVIAIRNQPDLVLDGASITLSGPDDKRVLSVRRLSLKNSNIVTNGGSLTIEADEVMSNGGNIISFVDGTTAPEGINGRSGGELTLRVDGGLQGILTVNLRGENGGDGKPGAAARAGAAGVEGSHSSSGAFDCSSGPGRGTNGQPGLSGGDGGAGGKGGSGGTMILVAANPTAILSSIVFHNEGGSPGKGGAAGIGGAGGPGGGGGASGGYCSGRGQSGDAGQPGPPGKAGASGAASAAGPPLVLRKAPD
jgi:hypothetical protein